MGQSIGQSQLEQPDPPLSAIGLMLADDIGRKWARGEEGLRIEVFSPFSFLLAWEDVMPSALQPGIHEERLVEPGV